MGNFLLFNICISPIPRHFNRYLTKICLRIFYSQSLKLLSHCLMRRDPVNMVAVVTVHYLLDRVLWNLSGVYFFITCLGCLTRASIRAVFFYRCPDCPSCPAHLNSTGRATWVIWAAVKICGLRPRFFIGCLICLIVWQCSQCKKATIHQLTTSKNVQFPGHNHLLTTGTDDSSFWLSPEHQQVKGHQHRWVAVG